MAQKKDWGNFYRRLFRREFDTPDMRRLIAERSAAAKVRDKLRNQLRKIQEEVSLLNRKKEDALTNAANDGDTGTLAEATEFSARVLALEEVQKRVEEKIPEADEAFQKIQKTLGGAVVRAAKKTGLQEQENFDQLLEDIHDRITSYHAALGDVINEIKAPTGYFFVGSKTDLNISKLLKALKL